MATMLARDGLGVDSLGLQAGTINKNVPWSPPPARSGKSWSNSSRRPATSSRTAVPTVQQMPFLTETTDGVAASTQRDVDRRWASMCESRFATRHLESTTSYSIPPLVYVLFPDLDPLLTLLHLCPSGPDGTGSFHLRGKQIVEHICDDCRSASSATQYIAGSSQWSR
jgi:hypothetical protein